MSGGEPVVVVSPADLSALVERAVRRCLTDAATSAPDLLLTVPQIVGRFDVGRKRIIKLIETGVLKAQVRKLQGGRDAYCVRYADCLRVLPLRQR